MQKIMHSERSPLRAPGSTPAFPWASLTAMVFATLIGASVSAHSAMAIILNKNQKPLHAVYLTTVNAALGLSMLSLPVLVFVRVKYVCPARWWTLLGGLATLPSIAAIPGSQRLGIQASALA